MKFIDPPTEKALTSSYCETVEWDDGRRQCSDDDCVKVRKPTLVSIISIIIFLLRRFFF